MAGSDVVEAEPVGEEGGGVKLDVSVARDARIWRLPGGVRADEVLHDPLVEELLEIEREVRKAHPVGRVPGEEDGVRRAARAAPPFPIVQPEGYARRVVASLLEEQGRYRRVHAAAGSDDHALATVVRSSAETLGVPLDEHPASLPAPVVLQSLMQSVQDERERVFLALRQRPA